MTLGMDLSRFKEKPKGHFEYRVRPKAAHPLLARPIRFTADGDDRARFIFRFASQALVNQGLPLMDLVLERRAEGEAEAWLGVMEATTT